MSPKLSLVAFFGIAFGVSWSCWITLAAIGGEGEGFAGHPLLYAGIPGPLIAACLLLYWRGSSVERRDFWRRIYEVERLSPAWLVVVSLLYPLLTLLAVGLTWLLGGPAPEGEQLRRLLDDPGFLFATAGFLLLLGPLPEEPGWRGYALDRLQMLFGAVAASLVLGALWAAWHLPLFFVPGSYQHGLGVGTVAFWLFQLTAVSSSVVITWVYRHNGRSIFAAILFHWSLNFTRYAVVLPEIAEFIRTALLILFALALVRRCGPATLKDCR